MSKALKLAAIAAAMVVGSTSVYATGGGLTAAQVRQIVKQEVAKVRQGPRGPAGARGPVGARGPAGMDGATFLSATVDGGGGIFPGTSNGITEDNMRRMDHVITLDDGSQITKTDYCFSGLPPVTGGQVTLVGVRDGSLNAPYLVVETPENEMVFGCEVTVYIGSEGGLSAANFHIMLY